MAGMTAGDKVRQAEYQNQLNAKRVKFFSWLDEQFEEFDHMSGVRFDKLTLKSTPQGQSAFLVIVEGIDESQQRKKAFGVGDTASGALENCKFNAEQRGLAFRDDKPWVPTIDQLKQLEERRKNAGA